MKWNDLAGNEITVGVFVAYAASWGRCPVLKYGKVVGLTTGQRVTLGFLDRLLVVTDGQVPPEVFSVLK